MAESEGFKHITVTAADDEDVVIVAGASEAAAPAPTQPEGEAPAKEAVAPEPAGEPFVSQTYLHTYFAGRTVTKSAPSAPPRPQKKLPWWRRLWIWLWNN